MVAEPAGAAVDPGLHLHAGGEPLYGLTAMRSAYVGRTDGWMDGRTDPPLRFSGPPTTHNLSYE